MKTLKTIVVTGLVLFLAACATMKTSQDNPSFKDAFVEEKGTAKKLILKFSPETPHYEVIHNKENTLSEVRWHSTVDKNFSKEFVFTERGRGVKKALVTVDSKTGIGTMTLWHDTSDAFSFSRQNATEFVLLPDDPFRSTSSKDDQAVRRINLHVKGVPLDKVLRTLSSESNKSLILGSALTGQVSVDLKNLTYEQAIDMILRPTGYRAEHAGEVTIIRSAKEDKTFRTFPLHYLDAGATVKIVQEVASKDAGVAADANTNTLFITDRFEALKNLELLLATIDVEPRQVQVEAAVVDVEINDQTQFGVDWSAVLHSGGTNPPGGFVSNPVGTTNLSPINAAAQQGAYIGVTWQSLNGVLSALTTRGHTNVIARPHVLALTDQDASVTIGSKLGYQTTTFSPTGQAIQNVNFLTVGTVLKIKPHITANNDVLMYLKPEVSSGALDPKTGIPNETTTETETKVLARNGQTVVIGGLFQDRFEKITARVPLLGDIPILGYAFGGTTNTFQKSEIVILLTPRIVTNTTFANMDRGSREHLGRFYDDNGAEMEYVIGQIGVRD